MTIFLFTCNIICIYVKWYLWKIKRDESVLYVMNTFEQYYNTSSMRTLPDGYLMSETLYKLIANAFEFDCYIPLSKRNLIVFTF